MQHWQAKGLFAGVLPCSFSAQGKLDQAPNCLGSSNGNVLFCNPGVEDSEELRLYADQDRHTFPRRRRAAPFS